MNLADVMDQIGDQVDTIAGLRVYRFPPDNVEPPFAIVTYPEDIQFDATYERGADTMTLPVIVGVGKVSDRSARNQLAEYCAGAGPKSIKAVIEAGVDAGVYTAFDSVRVQRAEFDIIKIAAVEYAAATFTNDITGTGAA